MTLSPNTPASPTHTPLPFNFGLTMGDDCNIPLVEILNIDSTLPVDTPRSETPTSEDGAEVDSPASPDPEITERVNAIVHYQKLTMFMFRIFNTGRPSS